MKKLICVLLVLALVLGVVFALPLITKDTDEAEDDKETVIRETERTKTLSKEVKDALGLSEDTDDSDEDGLTDYQELVFVGTDPLKSDTDENGVNDAEDDPDADGLSNKEEVDLETLPGEADSDFDGLNDGDEVNIYKTKPLVADTDGDGLADGEEIDLELNPKKAKTDGSTPDGERTFAQTASDEEVMDLALRESDNWMTPSIAGTVPGSIDSNVYLEKSASSAFNDNRAVLSDVIDLSTKYDSEPLTLSFAYDETYRGSMKSLAIASFGEDGLEIVETTIDERSQVLSGEIEGSGTYFVIDLDEFLKGLGIRVLDDVASYSVDDLAMMKAPVQAVPLSEVKTVAAKSGAMGKADVVFVIDTTGSMSGAISGVKNNVNLFAEKMVNEYNIDANFALIEYRDINVDGNDSTKIRKNNTSNWFTNVSVFQSEVDSLLVGGGGDINETPIDGLEMARRLDWRSDATKFIVLVTDAPYWDYNQYGIADMSEMIRLLKEDGIIVSAIAESEITYEDLVTETDGLYGFIYDSFSEILLRLAEKVGEITNADGEWVFLSDFKAVKLSDTLDNAATNDSDGDNLFDAQELGRSVVVDMAPYIRRLANQHAVPAESYTGKTTITVWDYKSNPVKKDTDDDGFIDNKDENPRKWDISDRDLAMAAGISYTDLVKGANIEIYDSIDLGNGADVSELIGWTVLDTCKGIGFYAAALKQDKNIVLAFRGSKPGYDWGSVIDADWISDWAFADVVNVFTGISIQAPIAKAFTQKIMAKYPDHNIYICGHSLGGNLALNASVTALSFNESAVKRVCTFNGLGMPNVGILKDLISWDSKTDTAVLARYAGRIYDYEIEGDLVSALEMKINPKWSDIIDVVLTTGFGKRIPYSPQGGGSKHSLPNFYLQLGPSDRPIE